MKRIPTIAALCLLALLAAAPARAQQAATPAPGSAAAPAPEGLSPDGIFVKSLLFTPAELAAIGQAEAGVVSGDAMLKAGDSTAPIPARRVIRLSGVVYRGAGDWVAWINDKKVTPDKLLPEIVDIKVEKEQVRLKWFDIGINGVIALTMRPHQTYDIVTGIMLPE